MASDFSSMLEGLNDDEDSKREGADAPLSSASTGSIGDGMDRTTRLLNAMKQVESGGDYDVVSEDGGRGAYQFMDATWKQWSNEYNNGKGALEQTSDNQDAVARHRVDMWIKNGLTNEEIAAKWNSGSHKDWENKRGTNQAGVKYDVPNHVKKVMAAYGSDDPTATGISDARTRAMSGEGELSSFLNEAHLKKPEPSAKKPEADYSQAFIEGGKDIVKNVSATINMSVEVPEARYIEQVDEMRDMETKNPYSSMTRDDVTQYQLMLRDEGIDPSEMSDEVAAAHRVLWRVGRAKETVEMAQRNQALIEKMFAEDPDYKSSGRFSEDLVRMGPEAAMQFLLAVTTGATSSMMYMGMSIAGSQTRQLLAENPEMDKGVALRSGLINAAVQMPMERFALTKMLKAGKAAPLGAKYTAKVLQKAKNLADRIGTNFLTEAAQKWPELYTELWAKNPDLTKLGLFEEFIDEASTSKFVREQAREGAMGAIMGEGHHIAGRGLNYVAKGKEGRAKARVMSKLDKALRNDPNYKAGDQHVIEDSPGKSVTVQDTDSVADQSKEASSVTPAGGKTSVRNLLGVDESTEAAKEESPGRSIGNDLTQTPGQSDTQLKQNDAIDTLLEDMKTKKGMEGNRIAVMNNHRKMDTIEGLYHEALNEEDHNKALELAESYKEVADETVAKVSEWMGGKETRLNADSATTKDEDIAHAQNFTDKLTRKSGDMVNGQIQAVRMQEAQEEMDYQDALAEDTKVLKDALISQETTAKNLRSDSAKTYREAVKLIDQMNWMTTEEFNGKAVKTPKMLELRQELETKINSEKGDQKISGEERAVDNATLQLVDDILKEKAEFDHAQTVAEEVERRQAELQKNAQRMTSADPKVQARKPKPKTKGQTQAAGIQAAAKRAQGKKRVQAEKKVSSEEKTRKTKAAEISRQSTKTRKTPATPVPQSRKDEIAASRQRQIDLKKQKDKTGDLGTKEGPKALPTKSKGYTIDPSLQRKAKAATAAKKKAADDASAAKQKEAKAAAIATARERAISKPKATPASRDQLAEAKAKAARKAAIDKQIEKVEGRTRPSTVNDIKNPKKSISILTSDNPMSTTATPAANRKARSNLETRLKAMGIDYEIGRSQFGKDKEIPFILHGVTESQAAKISKDLGQSSYIHMEGDKASLVDQKEGRETVARKDIRGTVKTGEDFTEVNGEKFQIPFFEDKKADESFRVDEIGDGTTTTPKGMAQVTVTDKTSPGFKHTFVVDPNKDMQKQVDAKIKANQNIAAQFQISDTAKDKAAAEFTSAAIKIDGKVWDGSMTHMQLIMDNSDLAAAIEKMPSEQFYARVEKGFIDSSGKFVDRLTAGDRLGLKKGEYLASEDFLTYELQHRGVVEPGKLSLKDQMGTLELLDAVEEEMADGPYAWLFKKTKAAGTRNVFTTGPGQFRQHNAVKGEYNNMKALEQISNRYDGAMRPNPQTGQMKTIGGVKGLYLPNKNVAFANLKNIAKIASNLPQAMETVVHEHIHALVAQAKADMTHGQRTAFDNELAEVWKSIDRDFLNAIRDDKNTPDIISNGIIQIDQHGPELVTYALAHPEFAAWLDKIPAGPRLRAQSSKIKTLWDKLARMITKLTGMPSKHTEVMDVLNRHLKFGEKQVKFSKETDFDFGANVTVDNVTAWHDELTSQANIAAESVVVEDAEAAEAELGFKPDNNVASVWIKPYDTTVYGGGKTRKVHVPAKVVFIADRIQSKEHFVEKWMHEQVAHHGLREVFGKNTALFDRFLDNAYTLFSIKDKGILDTIVELYDFGKINDKGQRVLTEQNKRDAAEEVIALRAEKLTTVSKTGLVNRMKTFLRKWLPKNFVGVLGARKGVHIALSDKSIMTMLEASKAHVMQGDTKYADFINKSLQARAPKVPYKGWKTLPKFMKKDSVYLDWVAEVVDQAPQLRKWYDNHMDTIRTTFGDDSDLFQILLAVTSPQIDVERNVQYAIDSYAYMMGLRDKPGSLYPNKLKERMDEKWTSPEGMFRDLESTNFKVTEFGRALLGDEMATVGDIWMYRAFFGDPAVQNKVDESKGLTKPHVVALRQKLHDLASQMTEKTGETYTPREVQAAIWVAINAKQTGKDISKVADFQSGLNKPAVKYDGMTPLEWLKSVVPNLSDGPLSQKTGVKNIPLAPISPLAKQRIQQIRHELKAKGQKIKYNVDSDGHISWVPKNTDADIQSIASALEAGGRTIEHHGNMRGWLKETFGFEDQGDGTMLLSQRAEDLFKSKKTGKVSFPAIRDNLGGFSGAYTREVMFSRKIDKAHNKLKSLDAQKQAELDAEFIKTGNDGTSVVGKIHEWRDTASRNVDRFITGLEQEFLDLFGGRKTLAKGIGSGKLVRTNKSDLAQKAMNLYIDSGTGDNRAKAEAYMNKLLRKGKSLTHREKDQVKVIDRMLNLSAGEIGWAKENISPYYEDYFKFAQANKIIDSHRDNYVKRTWKMPKELEEGTVTWNGVGTTGFTLTANSGKQRTFDSIIDGWARGMELQAGGVLTNLKNYADEIGYTYANRRFVEYMRTMITFEEGALMHEVNMKTDPTWKPPSNYVRVADRGFAKPFHKLYARKDIGIMLNKLSAKPSEQLWKSPLMKGVAKINASLKSTILSVSMFHHLAGMRSYLFGVSGKKGKEWNPIRAYKRGLAALATSDSKRLAGHNNLGPIVDLLVKEGLTVGKTQDWDESMIRSSKVSELLAGGTGKLTAAARNVWDNTRMWKQGMTQGLFARLFAGLKAEAGSIELVHSISKQEKKLGRPLNDQEIKKAAQQVASLINADFGGLHLSRMGRNPDLQKWAQLFLLAPDWTESNWRTVTGTAPKNFVNRAIDSTLGDNPEVEGMTSVYRKFWAGIAARGALSLILAQGAILAMGTPEERDEYWDFVKENISSRKKFTKGRWASLDLTPLAKRVGMAEDKRLVFNMLGHFKDVLKAGAPLSLAKHKASPIGGAALDTLTQKDWKGNRFTTIDELFTQEWDGLLPPFTATNKYAPATGGVDEILSIPSMLGYRVRQSMPIFLANGLEVIQGESTLFAGAARAAGFDVRDVGHQSAGQRKYEEVRSEVNELDRNLKDAQASKDRGLIKEAKQDIREYKGFNRAKSRMSYARTQLSVVNKKIKALELKRDSGERFSKTDERRLERAEKDKARIYERFLKVINR